MAGIPDFLKRTLKKPMGKNYRVLKRELQRANDKLGDDAHDLAVMGEAFKEESRIRKKANKERGKARLNAAGIKYTEHNNGTHLRIPVHTGTCVDYWPSTGRWRDDANPNPCQGRGIQPLLRYLRRVYGS